jgi:anionic cell wall polymer biosynthesis LytR-Cps2A-Psr (LCP) family protein
MNTNQNRRDWSAQQRPVISPARRGPVAPRRSWKRLIIPLLVVVVVLPVVFAGWLWFPAGCQTLNGPDALTFVRMRYSDATPRSDLDRVVNQRKFIGALAAEASSITTLINPFRAYALADEGASALTMLDTDGPGDLLSLGWAMRGMSSGGVVTTTVPVTDAKAHQWDREKALRLFKAMETDDPVPEDLIVN